MRTAKAFCVRGGIKPYQDGMAPAAFREGGAGKRRTGECRPKGQESVQGTERGNRVERKRYSGEKRQRRKILRFWVSIQKERKWLEEMALQGWFLENLTLGIFYTFVKGEPKRMLYDVDRFNLPKKPTLEEIRHKEMFLEMAEEMGWREVCHDESLTYYFTKEYEEGGVNELHNDPESRRYRAEKFRSYLQESAKRMVFWSMVMAAMDTAVMLLQAATGEFSRLDWFHWVTLVYVIFTNGIAMSCFRLGARSTRELSLTRQEWEESIDPNTHKCVRKLIFRVKKLKRFLQEQAKEGWVLTGVTPVRYFFEKQESTGQIYTMDSRWLVNRRLAEQNCKKIADGKDWTGINNDWQLKSVRDAEEKGWTFVCALENRSMIYRGDAETAEPLNDKKYDGRIRWISLVGEYGSYLLLCGLLGGIIGFITAMLTDF